jgi:hypothetical protein
VQTRERWIRDGKDINPGVQRMTLLK